MRVSRSASWTPVVSRKAKKPTPPVRKWRDRLIGAFRTRHLKPPPKSTLLRLAGLLTLVGERTDDEAAETYWAFVALFAHRKRQARWSKAVDNIPPEREKILRIKDCVKAYNEHIMRLLGGKEIAQSRFKLDRVIKVMVQIPDADEYVKALSRQGFDNVGGVFHPNTLENMRERYRGMFGYDGSGDGGGGRETMRDLRVYS